MRRFEGKVAIVTGGGGGIGSAISRRLAEEGALVIVSDVNGEAADAVAAEIVADGGSAVAVAADISRKEPCFALIAEAFDQRQRLDILVNNAGINRRGNLLSLTDDDWHASFTVNLDSMFHLCRAAVPHMIEAGAARSSTPHRNGVFFQLRTTLPTTRPRLQLRPSRRILRATTPLRKSA